MPRSRRHALGQHFLKNPRILQKIADTISPQKEDLVIEIGAGEGTLTRLLAEAAGRVIAIEKDPRLLPALQNLHLNNVVILEEDALRVDFRQVTGGKTAKIAGNLPYSISTPLLFRILAEKSICQECHFLLQKVVAERICATPGTKKIAPLSLLLQNDFETGIRFRVARGSFSPPPQVDSAFVSLIKRKSPLFSTATEARFQNFLQVCFQQRRKKLANNLKSLGLSPDRLAQAYSSTEVNPDVRSEQLSLQQFVDFYQALML